MTWIYFWTPHSGLPRPRRWFMHRSSSSLFDVRGYLLISPYLTAASVYGLSFMSMFVHSSIFTLFFWSFDCYSLNSREYIREQMNSSHAMLSLPSYAPNPDSSTISTVVHVRSQTTKNTSRDYDGKVESVWEIFGFADFRSAFTPFYLLFHYRESSLSHNHTMHLK